MGKIMIRDGLRNEAKIIPYLFLAPALLITILFGMYPFLYMIRLSLSRGDVFGGSMSFSWFRNYESLFTNAQFWNALKVTAIYVVAALLIEMLLGMAMALLLRREIAGKNIIRSIFLFPMCMSPVIVGLIWRWMYNTDYGIINYALSRLGIPGQAWLVSNNLALPSVIISDIWEWTPYIMLILLAGLQGLSDEIVEASVIDGANWWQTVTKIFIPMIKPLIAVAVTLRLTELIKDIDKILIMTYGGPGEQTQVIGFFTYIKGFKYYDINIAAALGVILIFAVSALCRYLVKNINKH